MTESVKSGMALAEEYWRTGMLIEAGKILFERVPAERRPIWASRILKLVLEAAHLRSPLFDEVIRTAEDETMWSNGHRVFDAVRVETLKLQDLERPPDDQESTLFLAELVAKVTYNATNPTDEFDEDSGWWIASLVREFLDSRRKDEAFEKVVWYALQEIP